jgi:hypothetical protein
MKKENSLKKLVEMKRKIEKKKNENDELLLHPKTLTRWKWWKEH